MIIKNLQTVLWIMRNGHKTYLCGIASMFGIPETRFAAAENLDVVGADIEANLNEARKVLSRLKATR